MRVYKDFFFEAAHFLPSAAPGHPNARVHGHSFRARVTIDGKVRDLEENQSAFVPAEAIHRLENPGKEPLELIEVQTGKHLSEDDIERLEDDYRRKSGE